MICCQFIFKPGTYDDDFHRLDAEIDDYARSLPGFDRVEKWLSPEGDVVNAMYYFADRKSVAMLGRFPQHREAKGTGRSAGTTATASSSPTSAPPTATAASPPRPAPPSSPTTPLTRTPAAHRANAAP